MRLGKNNLLELLNAENEAIQKSKNKILELENVLVSLTGDSKFSPRISNIKKLSKNENKTNANQIINLIDTPFNSSYTNSYYLVDEKVEDKYFEKNLSIINHIQNEIFYKDKKEEFEKAISLQIQIDKKINIINKIEKDNLLLVLIFIIIFLQDISAGTKKWYEYIEYIIVIPLMIIFSALLGMIIKSIRLYFNKDTLKNLEKEHKQIIFNLKESYNKINPKNK